MASSLQLLGLNSPPQAALFSASTGRGTAWADFPDCVNGPLKDNLVCDTTASHTARAQALINEFTLDELVNNTINTSPGVPRLGLPAYQWWSEALHGVAGANPGVHFAPAGENFSHATSFPQPILMGAAFDDQLVHDVATVISTEARAFNNFGFAGIDYFTPNINPFRDPRWGRGQETPGEDPLHISRYVYHLVTALQGGVGPSPYFKVMADCKHFAGYDLEDWEGIDRFHFDAQISTQDLAEFYTPMFKSCVRDAKVASVMCSYNSVNGVPSCANPFLLQDLIRDFYGLGEGWITSDCDAIDNVWSTHNFTDDAASASAISLLAGTDVDCGSTYAAALGTAVNQSLVSADDVKQSLVRLYSGLVRTGYFDPPEQQPFRQLNWDDVDLDSSRALALTAAEMGIVLMKNDGILPLTPDDFPNVVMVGPWGNQTTMLQGNYFGTAPFIVSPRQGFVDAGFNVTFFNGTVGSNGTDTTGFAEAVDAAGSADLIVFVGGPDEIVERESRDRINITWPGVQLDLIRELAAVGKPFVVVQFGGGQVDDTELKANSSVNALLWAGYPGQSGGTAVANIVTGKTAPAGRLPITQYPADFISVPMTDMTLRPSNSSPGRTYKWFTGEPVFEFGFGLHFTNFSVNWAAPPPASFDIAELVSNANSFVDLAPFHTFTVNVTNTGSVASDYVTLLFSNTTAGPSPAPLKELVSYARVKGLEPGASKTASLVVTLGSIARVDEDGHSVLFPGNYTVFVDTTRDISHSFELVGNETRILTFPQPPSP
ncbi:glycoside hydrolase family 3 protein [Exidia glandulosa HHB12029]|uniref:xylan 1,4-beta-xylosidase n=1 Tax=Exidia glandulosa HHB12029 TaxID=1314781 RepID=A0A165PTC3_EXIGL|nr:glycoside hydrolase family 3 protein [Exidia glandulosa HHB12029]